MNIYYVLYTTKKFNVPEAMKIKAKSSDKAESKFLKKMPEASVTWIVEGANSEEEAFDIYHKESSFFDEDEVIE